MDFKEREKGLEREINGLKRENERLKKENDGLPINNINSINSVITIAFNVLDNS